MVAFGLPMTPNPTAIPRRRRARITALLLGIGLAMLAGYSAIFQLLMSFEGHSYPWITALYWTIVTMSTLGYGDIAFTTPLGHAFSIWVLISGLLYLLALLPYVIIQYVITPWLNSRAAARIPRHVSPQMREHVVLVGNGAVVQALIARAMRSGIPCVLLTPDPQQATTLHDQGFQVLVGPLDSATTYRNAGVERAAIVVATLADAANTNIAFTVRQVSEHVTMAVTATKHSSVDVLQLTGADHVLELGAMLGKEMAARIAGTTGRAHPIGNFGRTLIAEAHARGTSLEGLSPQEARSRLPERVQVLTILRQGRVRPLEQEQVITDASVLILAGTAEDLAGYDATFQIPQARESRVLILGGGRVGRAAARALTESDVPCTIVEQIPGRAYDDDAHVVEGDAADIEVLHAAGLDEAQAALVTTHDDDLNIFLTLYCRRLFPDLQVVSRATVERNVATLYRAGADAVLSYAAIGATALWNDAGFPHRMVIAEGHELFEVPATGALAGSSVRDERVFQRTGCRIVAILRPDGAPAPISEQIKAGDQVLVLGDRHSEEKFRRTYLRRRR